MNAPSPLTRLALAVPSLILLMSCASPRATQDTAYRILREFSLEASQHVEFDPYTAQLHYDQAAIQAGFERMQVRLRAAGCGEASPLWTYLGGSLNGDEGKFLDHWYTGTTFQNIQWKRDLYRQLLNGRRGWAIVQTDYPKAGMQHGDFTVKALFAYYVQWVGANGRGGDYSLTPSFWFEVKSRAKENASKPEAPLPDDIAAKLRKLKEMFDAGLITKEEYEQKRKALVDKL